MVHHKISRWAPCAIALLSLSGCSKSSTDTATSVVGITTASCDYAEIKQCYEYFTSTAAQTYQSTCSESTGTWSATKGCKTEGRVKGCQATTSGAKVFTLWTYDAEDGPAAIDAFCSAGNRSGSTPGGTVMTVVNP